MFLPISITLCKLFYYSDYHILLKIFYFKNGFPNKTIVPEGKNAIFFIVAQCLEPNVR